MNRLKNYMELLVDELLLGVIAQEEDICKCEKCLLDIKAIALNRLPAKYIVTEIGEIYRRYDELGRQLEIDTIEAITRALELVRKHPKHE